jgi:vancomycin resistance protein VanJ
MLRHGRRKRPGERRLPSSSGERQTGAMARRGEERARRAERVAATPLEIAAATLAIGWLVGQLARDATHPTALLFYLPSLVVAAALLLLAGAALARRRRAVPILLLAVAPLVVGLAVEHRWLPRAPVRAAEQPPLRLLHWNVSGGWKGLDEIAREIARRRPDLVVLSEAPERVASRVAAELPGLDSRSLGALSVLAPRVEEPEWLERTRELHMIAATIPWQGRRLRLLAANLASSPWIPRQPSLARVRSAIVERAPDLVVGDFNAPRRSRLLARLPEGYRHAYDEAGCGWSASWPEPVPLLSLDHVIVGRALDVRSYTLESAGWSDHRLQVAELTFAAR